MSGDFAAAHTPRRRRFLIVQTGSALPTLARRHGDFPDWFRRGLGLARGEIETVRVDIGERLPDPHRFLGAVITGSPAMVSDRLEWSERTAGWLRAALDAELPLLGVCYGHQLLAHALGGRVGDHPRGREVGTVEVQRCGAEDALFGTLPPRFRAHVTHRQSVLELPPGAVVLARSAHEPHQAVRYAPGAWGLQFHPEFSTEVLRGYLQRPVEVDVNCAGDCCADRRASPAPFARALLRRFRAHALRAAVQ